MAPPFHPSDVPIPTTRPPHHVSATTIRRAKTLTRPERGVAPVPLVGPSPSATNPSNNGSPAWRIFSRIVTFWVPDFLLASLGGMKDPLVRQAWREKLALCFIIAILCTAVGFVTVGLQTLLCPPSGNTNRSFIDVGSTANTLGIQGIIYNITNAKSTAKVDFTSLAQQLPGQDITTYFQRDASQFSACQDLSFRVAVDSPCSSATPCPLPSLNASSTFTSLSLIQTGSLAGYTWNDVAQLQYYFVIDGAVLNMRSYVTLHPQPVDGDTVDAALRTVFQSGLTSYGNDATRLFYSHSDLVSAVPCLKQRYSAGNIDKVTPGCFISSLILYIGLIVILGLVMVRFIMACVFNWFLSERLAGPPTSQDLNRSVISPAVLPGGANVSIDNKNGTAPWARNGIKKIEKVNKSARSSASASSGTLSNADTPVMSLAQIGSELFAICLVTCYSEGEESLRTTLDSISSTTYSDARKLLFVIADGMITGAGEKRSTPDICVSLLEADPRFGNPMPMSYGAVGAGAKAYNRAMVYAGHYSKQFLPLYKISADTFPSMTSGRRTSYANCNRRQVWYGSRGRTRQETWKQGEARQSAHLDEFLFSRYV